MTTNHLLSTSLYTELFHHNIISTDGRIIANEEKIKEYYTFLIKQSKQKVVELYLARKNLVDAAEKLLRQPFRTNEQNKNLKLLLNELDLEFDDDGLLCMKEPKKSKKRYLGPSEPKMTLFEREIEAEIERVRILKRDLAILEDWLDELAKARPKADAKEPVDYKAAGKRFRNRTRNRMDDMEKARESLIKEHYSDYERMLKRVLFPRNIPAWVYPKRKHTRRNEEHGESSRMMEEESCEIKPTVSDKIKTEQETTIRIKAEAEQSDINSEGEPSVKSEEELETPEKTVTEEALPKIKTEEKFAAKVKDEPDSPEE